MANVVRTSEAPPPGEANPAFGGAGVRGVAVEFTSLQPRHRRLVVHFVEQTLASLAYGGF